MREYILVFGCSTIDISFYQKDKSTKISFGGKGSNQAVATAKAGKNVVFLTRLSKMKEDKKNTKLMIKNFKKNKINIKHIEFDKNHHNDYTRVDVSANGDNILSEHPDISNSFSKDFVRKNVDLIRNAEYVLMQLKVPNDVTKELFKVCKKYGVKTVLTPCRTIKEKKNPNFVESATYVTCNQKEVAEIFGNGENNLTNKQLNEILRKYPNKLIVTLGKNGVKWFDGKKICFEKSIKMSKVLDTTGAGDTFCGNFVASLSDGLSIRESIRKGICASTLKIQKIGTQDGMPLKKERDKLYNEIYSNEK